MSSDRAATSSKRVPNKIARWLMPLPVLSYLATFLDRVSVGFAAIGICPDINAINQVSE